MPFADYLAAGVLQPLGMRAELRGSPAADLHGSLDDLLILARELQRPTLVAPETLAEATTVQFPGLAGVLPDFGRFDPNDWGLGFELRDDKSPHWTGSRNSPRTFGHFGGSGTFLWVDPEAGLALGVLTNLDFGDWAKEAWPRLSDAVLGEEIEDDPVELFRALQAREMRGSRRSSPAPRREFRQRDGRRCGGCRRRPRRPSRPESEPSPRRAVPTRADRGAACGRLRVPSAA